LKSLPRALLRTLVAAVVAAAAGVANASPEGVRLEYAADEQAACPAEEELRRMVVEQLKYDPFDPQAEQRVAVSVARTDGGFQGRIAWMEADGRLLGERVLSSRGRDCRELAANVAFAVALQLQLVDRRNSHAAGAAPPNAEPPTSPPKADDPTPRSPPEPEPPSQPPPAPPPPEQPLPARWRLLVGAGPGVATGMTPRVSALGRLFIAARLERWSAEVAADAAWPATQREPDGSGVLVHALGSTAAGCGHAGVASACVLGRLGWMRARGVGVKAPNTSWGRFVEVGMRLAMTKELGRLSISLHADGLVMLSRWDVVLNDAVVWTVPRVGGGVGVDLALRFF
jgi:hypothetical protein